MSDERPVLVVLDVAVVEGTFHGGGEQADLDDAGVWLCRHFFIVRRFSLLNRRVIGGGRSRRHREHGDQDRRVGGLCQSRRQGRGCCHNGWRSRSPRRTSPGSRDDHLGRRPVERTAEHVRGVDDPAAQQSPSTLIVVVAQEPGFGVEDQARRAVRDIGDVRLPPDRRGSCWRPRRARASRTLSTEDRGRSTRRSPVPMRKTRTPTHALKRPPGVPAPDGCIRRPCPCGRACPGVWPHPRSRRAARRRSRK